MKKQPYIFYLSEDLHKEMAAKSAETGISMSALTSEAVLNWFKAREAAREAARKAARPEDVPNCGEIAQNGGDRHDG